VLLAISLPAAAANAQASGDEVAELRQMILEMRDDYERRISELEARLDIAEREARVAKRDAGEAFELAEEASIQQSSGSSAPNTFNPSIGVVLDGGFADVGAGWEEIPGFQPAGEIGTGESGFSPGEVEINLKANVDTRYFGNVTFALAEEDGEVEVEFEEAWVQTTALPAGFTVMGGRFFSESGYLNDFHFHAGVLRRPLYRRRHTGALGRANLTAVRGGHRAELGRQLPRYRQCRDLPGRVDAVHEDRRRHRRQQQLAARAVPRQRRRHRPRVFRWGQRPFRARLRLEVGTARQPERE
jgi:hypothetical protein